VDWDRLADEYGEAWGHEELVVAEPFASLFRLHRTRRYDLLACMLRDLKFPKSAGWATEQFLNTLYDRVAAAADLGLLKFADQDAQALVLTVLWELDDHTFFALTDDLRWDTKLRVSTTPSAYSEDFRELFARRFAPRLGWLLRQYRARRQAA
jgi:hypothetical protein